MRYTVWPKGEAGVYRITLTRGGKPDCFYIGQAKHFRKRWGYHKYSLAREIHSNNRMSRAYKKYGITALKFEPLLVCAIDKKLLDLYEQSILDLYVSTYGKSRILNECLICVGSRLGTKSSKEHCQKISERLTGCTRSEKTRALISLRKKGVSTPGHKEAARRASERMKGKPPTPQCLEASIAACTGTKKSLEEMTRRTATRMANGSYKRTPAQIAKYRATILEKYGPDYYINIGNGISPSQK